MTDAAQLDGQGFGVDRLPRLQSTQRNLGGGDQIQVGVFDAVDLSFRAPRNVARTVQDLGIGEVRSNDWRKTFGYERLQGKLLECKFQQHRLVAQEVETRAGDTSSTLKVDQVVFLSQLDMIERLEIESRKGSGTLAQLQVRLVIRTDGSGGVRHVGDARLEFRNLRFQLVVLFLRFALLLAEFPPFFDQRRSLFGRRLGDLLVGFVGGRV